LIVLTGCENGFLGGSSKDRSITDVDIRKGFEGLNMKFTKNAPPESVFEDNIFPIAINLRNLGATDIEATDIKDGNKVVGSVEGVLVFGFETSLVDLDNEEYRNRKSEERRLRDEKIDLENRLNELKILKLIDSIKIQINNKKSELDEVVEQINELITKEIKIDGKSVFNPNGDEYFITVDGKTKVLGAQSEKQSSTILATACYPYKTIFGTSVCIDTDIYGISRGQKACSITDLKFGKGQGAPVAITKVETRMLPQDDNKIKPLFLIHIENKGNGEVIKLSETQKACTEESLDYKDFNTIIVDASLSGKPLDCRIEKDGEPSSAEIRLREKKGIIRCTLEEVDLDGDGVNDIELIDTGRDAYVAPLRIELDYGYTFTISKDIIIEKILTY